MDNFEEKINARKEYIEKQELTEEFKTNLSKKMDAAYKPKAKGSFLIKYKKLSIVFACFIILSSVVFADNIENWILRIFKNSNKELENIAEEDIQYINSEYVTCNGVSINVEYVYRQDKKMTIVFNMSGIPEYTLLNFEEVEIRNQFNESIYIKNGEKQFFTNNFVYDLHLNKKDNKNTIIVLEISGRDVINVNFLKIIFKDIRIMYIGENGDIINIKGNWELEIDNIK